MRAHSSGANGARPGVRDGMGGVVLKLAYGAAPVVALAVVAAAFTTSPAGAAAPTSLYVDNGPGTNCSDSGPGSAAAPFCTISAAAAVVQPGQTVNVGQGDFPQQVDISARGTASAPITFVGQSTYRNPMGTMVGMDTGSPLAAHAFVFRGAQNVVIKNFQLASSAGDVLVGDSQNVTVDQVYDGAYSTNGPALQVTGASGGVTLSRSVLRYGIDIGSGVAGTTVTTNVLHAAATTGGGAAMIRATGAPGTVIVSNTVSACAAGIDLEGSSSGSTIENNIVEDASVSGVSCGGAAASGGVTVASGATSGTTSDYNVVDAASGAAPYSWAGVGYAGQLSFTAATGQGGHDSNANAWLTAVPATFGSQVYAGGFGYPAESTPEIDSANKTAPGELATDIFGMPRIYDPLVSNTGSLSGYYDRGAFEFQDPIAFVPPSAMRTTGGAPQQFTITSGVTDPWSQHTTYTYDFQDGTAAVVTTASTVTHTFPMPGKQTVVMRAADEYTSTFVTDPYSRVQFAVGADYTPVTPVRVLDTRNGIGLGTTSPVAANSSVTLTVAGVDGVPATGVSAVTMNVTVTDAAAAGYLTVYPDGLPRPAASNLNFAANETVPNLVTVPVVDGRVDFYNAGSGTTHVIADLEGYYSNSGYDFHPTGPVRVLDTRIPIGVAAKAPVGPGGRLQLDLGSNTRLLPGTKAVTLNVTVTEPTSNGYLTIYPDGTAQPVASNLNFAPGETVPNLVTVAMDNGKIDFYNGSTGTVSVVADLEGYYAPWTNNGSFSYLPVAPVRVLDTRAGVNPAPIAPFGTMHLNDAINMNGAPPGNATGAVMNVTVTGPTAGGFLTVYPDHQSPPTASNLNFAPGETVPNLVATVFGGYNGVDAYNSSTGSTNLVVDVEGYFLQP